ncbi:hypothetical protein [Streptomyces antibioticus]|uniref:hypothetical protein n=1 Tax=Streptomyces antibioticus TaxID=1890 RepID=UPI003D754A63
MKFDYVTSPDPFVARRTGARLDPDTRCQHDDPVTFIALYGNRRTQRGRPEDRLDILVPRCALASLVGIITAQIRHEEGEAAAAAFLDQAEAHATAHAAPLQEMRAAARDCCEAGFRTGGAEHTCGREAGSA